jgi:hypothetical protein
VSRVVVTSQRSCLGCRYYIGDNKCQLLPWRPPVKIEDPANFVCPNFCYKEAYCVVCGKPINPLKLLMSGSTVYGVITLKSLKFQGVETKFRGGYVIYCLKHIPKDYDWGEHGSE